jgi:hypothetical protein
MPLKANINHSRGLRGQPDDINNPKPRCRCCGHLMRGIKSYKDSFKIELDHIMWVCDFCPSVNS